MPQPTASDVHVNMPLTQISIAFLQDQSDFVADKVFPNVPVTKQSDRYYQYDKKQWFRSDAAKRAPATESAGSGFTIDNTPTYYCDVRAIHKDVDDQIRANADGPIDMDRDATEFVTRDLALGREITWTAQYFAAGIWTGSSTGTDVTPAVLWDASGSTPIEDMRKELIAVKKKTGFKPNTVVIGEEVWNVLQDHPDFLERIKYTQRAIVSVDLLAAVLGIDRVLIAGAIADRAGEGAADDMDFLLGSNVLLAYSAPRPSLLQPTAGYTFSWTGYLGAGAQGNRISRFRMEHLKADRVEGEMAYDQKVVANEMASFMVGVIS